MPSLAIVSSCSLSWSWFCTLWILCWREFQKVEHSTARYIRIRHRLCFLFAFICSSCHDNEILVVFSQFCLSAMNTFEHSTLCVFSLPQHCLADTDHFDREWPHQLLDFGYAYWWVHDEETRTGRWTVISHEDVIMEFFWVCAHVPARPHTSLHSMVVYYCSRLLYLRGRGRLLRPVSSCVTVATGPRQPTSVSVVSMDSSDVLRVRARQVVHQ